MTKKEIDEYFTNNYSLIVEYIDSNKHKCLTVNDEIIITQIYIEAIKSKERINNLPAWIRITSSNIYKWKNSEFNKQNKVDSNNLANSYTLDESHNENETEINIQNLEFALKKYYLNAKPSERIFFDSYVNKGIRSIRKVQKHFGVTFRGAQVMINDFKTKIKEYAREE